MARPLWLNKYPIVTPEDSSTLEGLMMGYAGKGYNEDSAADLAYRNYVKSLYIKAAAYHLANLKSARASNRLEDIAKHSQLYKLHLGQLGHDVYESPPAVIESLSKDVAPSDKFKEHPGDMYLYDGLKIHS